MIFGQQRVRLYIVTGVNDDTAFAPLTKKEISVCGLHPSKTGLIVKNSFFKFPLAYYYLCTREILPEMLV